MASNFYVETSQSVGTSFTPVGGYVVGSNTQTTVIGLTIANSLSGNYNSTTTQIFVDAVVNDGTNNTYLVRNAFVPGGGSLVVIGGEQKVVLEPGYSIQVRSTLPASADAIMSVLELT